MDLVDGDRRISEVATDLGTNEQTINAWHRGDRVDRDLGPGLTTMEKTELEAARKRVRELETELTVHHRATELLKEHADIRAGSQPSR
jgi:transposase-like protein